MKKFEDLVFHTHICGQGIQARSRFPNGFGVSVIRTYFSYGGSDGLYELAVLDADGDLHYNNPVAAGDVRGWLSMEDVTILMLKIQHFDKEMLLEMG